MIEAIEGVPSMVSGSLPTALGSAENSLAQLHPGTQSHPLFYLIFLFWRRVSVFGFWSHLARACRGGIGATVVRVFHAF